MSIWEIILIVIGVIIISYLCNYCCRGKTQQGRILEGEKIYVLCFVLNSLRGN